MSTSFKNLCLLITLMSLCFLIKCKLDADKEQHNIKTEAPSPPKSETPEIESEITEIKDTLLQAKSDTEDSLTTQSKATQKSGLEKTNSAKSKKKTKPKTKKKTKKKVAKAKIEFEELTWNFGEITEGDIVKKNFVFKNTGTGPLQIIGADASCGCATPTVPFLDVAPGETNQIGITYNSVSKEGDQEPEIIIESNTYPKHTILRLFGTVKPKEKKDDKSSKKDSLQMNDNAAKLDTSSRN